MSEDVYISTADKELFVKRLKLISEYIENDKTEQEKRKVQRVANSIKGENDRINENAFWVYKRRMRGKKCEQKTAMITNTGEMTEDEQSIKNVYMDFYKTLLSTKNATTAEEIEAEKNVNRTFRIIEAIALNQNPIEIKAEHIVEVVKKLSRRKAGDRQEWTNELILEGGDEMIKSIQHMFKAIVRTQKIPEQWSCMKIKTIHKKGSKMVMDNKRGLFLTNVLSKVFERVLDKITSDSVRMSEYQCGGQRNRGTMDNMVMMRAVLDNNARLNKKTYCYFADAYKCFDKLWLKDCLVEMWRAGMREREVMLIYELNRQADIVIETPVGVTKSIKVDEIVKQGTVFGPKLCCISTEKVNSIKNIISTSISPDLCLGAPVYVDDILGVGSVGTVQRVIRNTREMEVKKKFRFSAKKSKYMVINTGHDKLKSVNESINDGEIEKTDEYKYLGWWFNEKNSADRQVTELESKLDYMVREIQISGSWNRVGQADAQIQLMLYKKIVVPTLLYNMETASNMKKGEYERLEKMQGKALRRICELPASTPYWGILAELGVYPLEFVIHQKRLMLYHNIMNSGNQRIAKQIIMQQNKDKRENGLQQEIHGSAKVLMIKDEWLDNYKMSKAEWKRMVNSGVQKKLDKELERMKKIMKKMRHIKKTRFKESAYVPKCSIRELSEVLRVKLNMTKLRCNYGKQEQCKFCSVAQESTEHMIDCEEVRKKVGHEIQGSIETESKCELMEISSYLEKVIKLNKKEEERNQRNE